MHSCIKIFGHLIQTLMNNLSLRNRPSVHARIRLDTVEKQAAALIHDMMVANMEVLVDCFVSAGVDLRTAKGAVEEYEKRTSVSGVKIKKPKGIYVEKTKNPIEFVTESESESTQPSVYDQDYVDDVQIINDGGQQWGVIKSYNLDDMCKPVIDGNGKPVLAIKFREDGMYDMRELSSDEKNKIAQFLNRR